MGGRSSGSREFGSAVYRAEKMLSQEGGLPPHRQLTPQINVARLSLATKTCSELPGEASRTARVGGRATNIMLSKEGSLPRLAGWHSTSGVNHPD
jgi:hypothetical protein